MALRRQKHVSFLALSTCLLLVYYFQWRPSLSRSSSSCQKESATNCHQPLLRNDILLVLRTGATEALQKLPVHIETTLPFVLNHVIFSDYEEDILGHHIHNALVETVDALNDTLPEVQFYKRLQLHGREGLSTEVHLGSGPGGSLDNPGWKLDKFKFLPMVEKALRYQPDAEWFVFIEPDTHLSWYNLVNYLSRFNSSKPYYIGKHMYIGDVLFAHGGSGFVLSKAAIQSVTQHWKAHNAKYLQYTVEQWAGDMVLGKVLRDVGIDLFWAFPNFQGDPISSLDHNITKIGRQPWCFAPITYHHMKPEEIRQLWEFEQRWNQKHDRVLLHSDVFRDFILPQLTERKDYWDNLSIGKEYSAKVLAQRSAGNQQHLSVVEREAHKSFENCRMVCESQPGCMQFSYTKGRCSTSTEVKLGSKAATQCPEYSNAAGKCVISGTSSTTHGTSDASHGSVHSGWIFNRLEKYMQEMDRTCVAGKIYPWVLEN